MPEPISRLLIRELLYNIVNKIQKCKKQLYIWWYWETDAKNSKNFNQDAVNEDNAKAIEWHFRIDIWVN